MAYCSALLTAWQKAWQTVQACAETAEDVKEMLSVRRLATLSVWRRGTPKVQWWEAPSVGQWVVLTMQP